MDEIGIRTKMELSRRTGIPSGVVSKHSSGTTEISTKSLKRYGTVLKISVDYLLFGKEPPPLDLETIHEIVDKARKPERPPEQKLPKDYNRIPLLTTVPAGELATWIDDYLYRYAAEYVQKGDLNGENLIALKVSGESMVPQLFPGDVVIVDLAKEFIHSPRGKIGVAQKNLEEATVKWVRKRQDGFSIESENPDFKESDFTIPLDDPNWRFLKTVEHRSRTEKDERS